MLPAGIVRVGAPLAECARMGLSIETMKPGDSARVTGLVAGDRDRTLGCAEEFLVGV